MVFNTLYFIYIDCIKTDTESLFETNLLYRPWYSSTHWYIIKLIWFCIDFFAFTRARDSLLPSKEKTPSSHMLDSLSGSSCIVRLHVFWGRAVASNLHCVCHFSASSQPLGSLPATPREQAHKGSGACSRGDGSSPKRGVGLAENNIGREHGAMWKEGGEMICWTG